MVIWRLCLLTGCQPKWRVWGDVRRLYHGAVAGPMRIRSMSIRRRQRWPGRESIRGIRAVWIGRIHRGQAVVHDRGWAIGAAPSVQLRTQICLQAGSEAVVAGIGIVGREWVIRAGCWHGHCTGPALMLFEYGCFRRCSVCPRSCRGGLAVYEATCRT
jgi:hypothetical protein